MKSLLLSLILASVACGRNDNATDKQDTSKSVPGGSVTCVAPLADKSGVYLTYSVQNPLSMRCGVSKADGSGRIEKSVSEDGACEFAHNPTGKTPDNQVIAMLDSVGAADFYDSAANRLTTKNCSKD